MVIIKYSNLTRPEKWLVLGIPGIFILGSLFHSLYDFTGKLLVIGLFAPVNESIWEHLKLLLFPVIGWWVIYYLILGKRYRIDRDKWFFGALTALVTSMLFQVAFYYTYTGALGIESIVLDILDLFISVMIGQCLGLYKYKYGKRRNSFVSILLLLLIVAIFITVTFVPPHIPIFRDGNNGHYGI